MRQSIYKWSLAAFFAVLALSPIGAMAYLHSVYSTKAPVVSQETPIASVDFSSRNSVVVEPGAQLNVLACKVLDGYRFEMYVGDGDQIVAHLTQATKAEAADEVVKLLNAAEPPAPTVRLIRQSGDVWLVEIHFTLKGERVSMVEVLKSKGLTL